LLSPLGVINEASSISKGEAYLTDKFIQGQVLGHAAFGLSLLERCNLLPAALEEQRLKIEKSRAAFFARYGEFKKFVEGRVVDFTDLIRHGDSDNPDPRVKSLYELSEKLFPIEDERETPEGLEAYVRPDHLGTHPRNERRIIAILNEDETKVIGAAIYGVAATPEALREETGIDGVVGLTYAMVDEEYRRTGLGNYIATQIVPQIAKQFLRAENGPSDPHIIIAAEINDVRQLTFEEAISDIEKTKLMPNARRAFWDNCDFKPLDWPDYAQLKLRDELEPFSALDLFINGWDGPEIPSCVLKFVVDFHARFCLNKQKGLDEGDLFELNRMSDSLALRPFIGFQQVPNCVIADAHLLEALTDAAKRNVPGDTPVWEILDHYRPPRISTRADSRTWERCKIYARRLIHIRGA
jgi:GNAT superfamily N-acetyltransferase